MKLRETGKRVQGTVMHHMLSVVYVIWLPATLNVRTTASTACTACTAYTASTAGTTCTACTAWLSQELTVLTVSSWQE